jgi:peptidoglycan/LPS O-acetylase OafA/YrhL
MVSTVNPEHLSADVAVPSTPVRRKRLVGLDGIRGLAALFVVLHHCFLSAFPGYPHNTGPLWIGFLIYGHFAVAVFIVLSGFSLAVAPARAGWHVDSKRKFFFRRAWRILPTYWPALLLSLIIAWAIIPQPGEGSPTGKSVVVNGLLLQDIFGAPTPNGAFWSIAVEVQLYLVFPLLILLVWRFGSTAMLAAVAALVVLVGILAPHASVVDKLMRLTPQFAVLFALGIAGAGVVRLVDRGAPPGLGKHRVATQGVADEAHPALRWLPWLALAAFVPMVIVIAVEGSVWTVGHFFWVDLALGPAIALFIASVAAGTLRPAVRLLDTRPVRSLGSFSYSLYLVHAPIVVCVYVKIVEPWLGHGVKAFLAMLLIAVPLSVLVARLFAAVFELPFTRNKSWPKLRAAISARMTVLRARLRPVAPAPVAEQAPATEG